MPNKFTQFVKNNKYRLDIIKSSFSILLGIVLIALLIFLAVNLANTTRKVIVVASDGITRVHSTLSVVNDGLENVSKSFETLNTSLETVRSYVSGVEPILNTVKNFIGNDLSKLALDGRDSLVAAAQGSKIVDDALSFLSRIPLLKFEYSPKKTLNDSLLDLSETFGSIPDSLETLEKGLSTSTSNLETFDSKFTELSTNITDMKSNMSETKLSISSFLDKLDQHQQNLPKTQRTIIIWISVITGILCLIVLIWMLSQVYTFIVAREGLKSDRITKRN